jgi:hypothetical protein
MCCDRGFSKNNESLAKLGMDAFESPSPPRRPTLADVASPSEKAFCSTCIHNQNLVIQLLAAYDPEDEVSNKDHECLREHK